MSSQPGDQHQGNKVTWAIPSFRNIITVPDSFVGPKLCSSLLCSESCIIALSAPLGRSLNRTENRFGKFESQNLLPFYSVFLHDFILTDQTTYTNIHPKH